MLDHQFLISHSSISGVRASDYDNNLKVQIRSFSDWIRTLLAPIVFGLLCCLV